MRVETNSGCLTRDKPLYRKSTKSSRRGPLAYLLGFDIPKPFGADRASGKARASSATSASFSKRRFESA